MSWVLVFLFLNLFELQNYWIIVNFFYQPCHPGGTDWARIRFLAGVHTHVDCQLHLCSCDNHFNFWDQQRESDLVQVFLITECTGVHEPPLVTILAVLQRFVVAVLFPTHRAHVSMIFIKMKIILMISSTNSFQSVRWRKYTWLVHDARLQYGPESQGCTRTL